MRITRNWIVTSAWPYVNGVPHLGTLVGSVLSADVFARYLRMRGHRVVFVSGSDEHGTVIEIEARKRGLEPKAFTDQAHEYIKSIWKLWNISFDNYTRTESEVHKDFVRDFLLDVERNGYIEIRDQFIAWCPRDRQYLADRFIVGTCPYCGYEDARGDQCDKCGRILDPELLINPKCAFCDSRPVFVTRKHWFFRLDKLSDTIYEWLKNHKLLHDNVKNYSISWIKSGLEPRAITRDIKWGIPAPFKGAEDKTVYVWFDALLGYISATKEFFLKSEDSDEWLKLWSSPETMTAYFIGKDNIPFHAIIFPALIIASSRGYKLPDIISATEYLLYEGEKFSKSRKIGVWADEAAEIFGEIDYWRYALMRMRPEDKDTSFKWSEFIRIVNSELNDDIGNFIHRTLTLIWRHFGGEVPDPTKMAEADVETINELERGWDIYTQHMDKAEIRPATEVIVKLARLGNQYITKKAPWFKVREDLEDAKTTLHVCFKLSLYLVTMLYPIMPKSSTALLETMGIENSNNLIVRDRPIELLKSRHRIKEPRVVFTKIPKELARTLLDQNEREKLINIVREKVNARRPGALRF
ncbi:MAG: methionine--tRNA ligase [Sulfolobales archaeon]